MKNVIEGKLVAEGKRFALVVSRFNSFITERLLEGALDALFRHGAKEEDLKGVRTAGRVEIPSVAKRVVSAGSYDGVICLGAVIRGSTPHFDYVAAEVSKGVAALSMEADLPVTFGVITTDTIEQAIERAGTKAGNKGFDAAMAAVELVNLYSELVPAR